MTPEEKKAAEEAQAAAGLAKQAEQEKVAQKRAKEEADKAAKAAEKAAKADAVKAAKRAELEKIAREYAKSYLTNKVFHICSDRMVFLEGDIADAKSHQSIIGGEVESITV